MKEKKRTFFLKPRAVCTACIVVRHVALHACSACTRNRSIGVSRHEWCMQGKASQHKFYGVDIFTNVKKKRIKIFIDGQTEERRTLPKSTMIHGENDVNGEKG